MFPARGQPRRGTGRREREEAGVAIHIAVTLPVRAARLPECGHLRERHGFLAEHNDLFIDLKPGYLVLLKEDIARLLLLRGVENAVDVLRHGSQLLPHADTWRQEGKRQARVEKPVG